MRCFVAKVTGLSRAQSTRLIGQYQRTGHIRDRRCGATRPFERRYTAVDIRLLAEVEETLGGLCGPTTRRVMRRQYEVFADSGPNRSPNPEQADHPFRFKPITDLYGRLPDCKDRFWCDGASRLQLCIRPVRADVSVCGP